MADTRAIALFGGTFDPVHLGHLHLAGTARQALALDEVRFLPCRVSPHKTGTTPTSAADRLAMLRLATTGLPWAVVDDCEVRRTGPSFSYQTAEELAARFPAARLFWLMGGDQWDALPQWRHPERLAACCEFIVLARGGLPQPREGYRLHVLETVHPASATAIRNALADGATNHPWLAPSVAGWIAHHGLYFPRLMPTPARIVTLHEPHQRWDPSDLLEAALAQRAPLLTSDTDAVRLSDGAGDGLPGISLETYAGRWLLSTTGGVIAPELLDWLEERGVSCYWKRLDRHRKESPTLLCGPEVTAPFLIREHGIRYEISFQAGFSQGIFLDQRDNRAEVRRLLRPGLRLLNAFAYTGGFSVAAAMAGATTTTLDLSQPYLDWAQRNFSHNRLDPQDHHFCKGDTFHWLRRFAKQKRVFDGIVLDPPTFSRDAEGKIFRAERDFGKLLELAAGVLAPAGWILCCTNCRGITPNELARSLLDSAPRPLQARHAAMPPDFTADPYLKSVWLRG